MRILHEVYEGWVNDHSMKAIKQEIENLDGKFVRLVAEEYWDDKSPVVRMHMPADTRERIKTARNELNQGRKNILNMGQFLNYLMDVWEVYQKRNG